MSTLANRPDHSAPMSDSDHDDDYEQSSSVNQANESMMHKVKDVVSKLLHPSFLFSAGGDTSRSKRKRTISAEENGEEKQAEVTASTTNGHGITAKSKQHRRPIVADEEPQLTDDEDNTAREVSPIEADVPDLEQSKKRRRTANYQHIVSSSTSTATANGHHQDERTSPPTNSTTTSVGSSITRRMLDYGPNTTNTTPVLLQTSTETSQNDGINRFASAKPRFNLPSTHRGLSSHYDPSQSPLFSAGSRKTSEVTMSPNRTTTNLKSQSNEFSANYLLATGLANRVQSNTSVNHNQLSSTLSNPATNHTPRLVSQERQMLGVNYASINSRRLPYIERLRRRTLQDCIRLNRTLDSEPLSISTIEEHTSTPASPVKIRKPSKASEKECGIQCNISTMDTSMEPSRKIQRTFPPADIREEALSVPTLDKSHTTSQTDSPIQTKSSITFEPIKPITNDITKPKVIGNITAFSWPKFARAQEEYAKKYPEKCRADAIPTPTSKPSIPLVVEKPITSAIAFGGQSVSTSSKTSIFDASPPRPVKTGAGPVWKCPSCTMEHPAQTASCSLCHGINPNYKRLSAIDSAPTIQKSVPVSKVPEIIVEEPVVTPSTASAVASIPVTTTVVSIPITATPTVTFSLPTTTKENLFSMPSTSTTAPSFGLPTSFGIPAAVSFPTTTKESITTAPPVMTSAPLFPAFPSSTTLPAFGVPAASTTLSSFSTGTSSSSTFPAFGTATTTASSTPAAPAVVTTTAAAPFPPSISAPIVFGSFTNPLTSTTTATTTTSISSTASNTLPDKPLSFSFGTSSSAPSLTALAASSTTATAAPSVSNPFSFSATPATSAATLSSSGTLPIVPNSGGFSFGSGFPSASSATTTTSTSAAASTLFGSGFPSSSSATTSTSAAAPALFGGGFPLGSSATTTTSTSAAAPALFGSGFPSASSSSSGFSFPPAGAATTTITSTSTPFAFGASSPSRTFAPSVVSLGTTGSVPAFGSGAGFGAPATSAPSFSGFASTAAPSFAFGASPAAATTSNPLQTSAASTGPTGGFAFGGAPSSVAAPGPVFGAAPSTFSFGGPGASSSFSFGASATAPTGSAPFQFSGASAAGPALAQPPLLSSSTLPTGFPSADANPFSVSDDSARRPMARAKRRVPKT